MNRAGYNGRTAKDGTEQYRGVGGYHYRGGVDARCVQRQWAHDINYYRNRFDKARYL